MLDTSRALGNELLPLPLAPVRRVHFDWPQDGPGAVFVSVLFLSFPGVRRAVGVRRRYLKLSCLSAVLTPLLTAAPWDRLSDRAGTVN